MKKIVITGGLGYIGMEVAKIYSGLSRTHEVLVIDNKFFSERVSQLKRWGIDYKQCDILDKTKLRKHIFDADTIFHLAGITDVPTTSNQGNQKLNTLIRKTGVDGTKNIINLSKNDVKIVFPSTHVIFEGLNKVRKNIDENEVPKPVLEYSKGKYQSELDLIESKKNYIILRLGSLYGNSYDSTRINIMPNLFSKMTSSGESITLFSKGKQLKSLVSVKDVARAMEFVASSDEINFDIFNCVHENLTVSEVALICQKYNKNIDLINTNDPIPNEGYTMSNKKILNKGFKFLYDIEKSIEEMISDWSNINIVDSNEILEKGANDFIDSRGIISNYYIDDSINMIGYVESVRGSIRGNHYHPVQTQKCLLIKGKYISVTKDLNNPNSVIETRLVSEGELSTIPPFVAHTMIFLEESIFLNLVNGEREHENYGATHTLKYDLVDKMLGNNLLNSYKTECRVCGGGLNHYLSLGLSPLANNLNNKKNDDNDMYPLDLNYCKQCSNSQLSVVVPPEKMFNNYLYLSSTSQQFREHFVNFAKDLKNNLKLKKGSVVVDIGSNDGIFLDPLIKLGINAIGIEPAKNVAKIANSKGLTTLPEYFDKRTSLKIKKDFGQANVVTAFNVFAHGDGLKDMLTNIEEILLDDGEFIFEIQYLLRTIRDLTFDNIYHEHVNYWCLLSILNFFEESKLKVYKVEEIDTHGGSLRVFASKNKRKKIHKSVNDYIEIEKKYKLDKFQTYLKFAKNVEKIKSSSLEKINNLLEENKRILGYGAPAKATTILNYFGINNSYFEHVIDDSSIKHNKYIPGVDIKIIDKESIDPLEIDVVLVLAWNFYDAIKKQNKAKFPKSKFIKLK